MGTAKEIAVFRKKAARMASHLTFKKFLATKRASQQIRFCHIERPFKKSKYQSSNVKSMTNDLMPKYF
jgi:hypothetical protein